MRAAAVLLLVAVSARAQDPTPYDLPIPPPSSATLRALQPPPEGERGRTLLEMQERGIVDRAAREWEPEDMALLLRMQEAERLRAFDTLQQKAGTLRGYAVNKKLEDGTRVLWLTKRGFERYFFIKSQQARQYFEVKGTDAKWVFKVKTSKGKKVFDVSGMLTTEGDALHTRVILGLPAEWVTGDGVTRSNQRPKRPTPSPVLPPAPGVK
ncbi:MAG: hypothetical protein HY553_19560 [Elusimicrobia bacterium]|nr:hypothetical protein [Elusimicrobiota bacterium]